MFACNILLLGFHTTSAQGATQEQTLGMPAEELVRQAVENELKAANAPGHYMYRLHEDTPDGTKTEAVIETKDWKIGRLMQLNGKPLTPEEREKEDKRLARLLNDYNALRKEEEDQRKEERRVRELVRALPDAFLYRYDGSAPNGQRVIQLIFQPKPTFRSPSRELTVLTGMKGTMLVDAAAMRLVRVEATLFRSVSFGWGFLARLDPGGRFLLEEAAIGSGRWAIKTLMLHFTGKLFLLKSLKIDSKLTTDDFRRMRDDLTLVEGLELLKEQDQMTPATEPGVGIKGQMCKPVLARRFVSEAR